MKHIIPLFLLMTFSTVISAQTRTIYDFKTTAIDGRPFNFSSLKGKKIMVVNTASKCGFTPQYAALERLYEKYKGQNFVIIGFPANNFKEQEPGSNREILEFCTRNYGVTFPMMEKISVVGEDMDPLYQWLTRKSENGIMDAPVKWNFQKFLINENGRLAAVALSAERPDSERIIHWIEGDVQTSSK